jgi:hypothetical protein
MKVYLYWASAKTRRLAFASVHDGVGCVARYWSAPSGTAPDAKNARGAKATGASCSGPPSCDARVRSASVVSGLKKCGAGYADFAALLVVISCRFCLKLVPRGRPGCRCPASVPHPQQRTVTRSVVWKIRLRDRTCGPSFSDWRRVSARIDKRSICHCATGAGQSCLWCAAVPVCDRPAGPRQVGTPRRLERLIPQQRRDLPVLRAHQLLQHRGCRRL